MLLLLLCSNNNLRRCAAEHDKATATHKIVPTA